MNPLGVHALAFASGWTQAEATRAIEKAADCGYQYLEIPLIDPGAIDVEVSRRQLEQAGIIPVTSLGLGRETDISSEDPETVQQGEALLRRALAVARDLGSTMLSGVLYSALGKYRKPPSEIGRWHCMRALGRLADEAKASGVTIGIEPVNRYESNLINTAAEALQLISTIGADNMVVHLNSYHMNIEEGAPGRVIEQLGDRLGYVQVNESHRGYLGTGSIDFAALFQALADHEYSGVITFEAFSAGIGDPALNAELAVWRPLWNDPDDLARHAKRFMTRQLEHAQGKEPKPKDAPPPPDDEPYEPYEPVPDQAGEGRETLEIEAPEYEALEYEALEYEEPEDETSDDDVREDQTLEDETEATEPAKPTQTNPVRERNFGWSRRPS